MPLSLLTPLLLFATTCTAVSGWDRGRHGEGLDAACSDATDYGHAWRLGASLHELRVEQETIEARLPGLSGVEQGVQRRRQRQLQNDIEAILGVATVNGWPTGLPQPREKTE